MTTTQQPTTLNGVNVGGLTVVSPTSALVTSSTRKGLSGAMNSRLVRMARRASATLERGTA